MIEKANMAEALSDALAQLAPLVSDTDPRVITLMQSLRFAAQDEKLRAIEAPVDLTAVLSRTNPEDIRSGAAFLTRPGWVVGRDLFSFDVTRSPQAGWHAPKPDEFELVAALERMLRAFGEDKSKASGTAATEQARTALAERLDRVNLSQEDVLIAVPPFLPKVRLIYVALSDPDGELPEREGLFYGVRGEDGGSWQVESFDYTSLNLHRLNQQFRVQIAGNELAYMRYFLQVVRSDQGAFREIDQSLCDRIGQLIADDPSAFGGDVTAETLFEGWHPMRCAGAWHSGGLKYDAWLLYGGDIFKARFVVFGSGFVTMVDDEHVAGTFLPLREQ